MWWLIFIANINLCVHSSATISVCVLVPTALSILKDKVLSSSSFVSPKAPWPVLSNCHWLTDWQIGWPCHHSYVLCPRNVLTSCCVLLWVLDVVFLPNLLHEIQQLEYRSHSSENEFGFLWFFVCGKILMESFKIMLVLWK